MRVGGTSEPWFKQQKVCERSRKGAYPIEKTANENIIMSEKHWTDTRVCGWHMAFSATQRTEKGEKDDKFSIF